MIHPDVWNLLKHIAIMDRDIKATGMFNYSNYLKALLPERRLTTFVEKDTRLFQWLKQS